MMYEELIKSLRELCEMTALCGDYSCFECPYEEKCSSYKNGRLSAIYRQSADAIETIPRWIPVTERLPKEKENVLAFGTLGVAWINWRHDNKWWCFGGVTHWMPLPEPPKEK